MFFSELFQVAHEINLKCIRISKVYHPSEKGCAMLGFLDVWGNFLEDERNLYRETDPSFERISLEVWQQLNKDRKTTKNAILKSC